MIGGWRPQDSQNYVRAARKRIKKMQEHVAAICRSRRGDELGQDALQAELSNVMLKKGLSARLVEEQMMTWSRVRKEAVQVTEIDACARSSDGENVLLSPVSDSEDVDVTDCEAHIRKPKLIQCRLPSPSIKAKHRKLNRTQAFEVKRQERRSSPQCPRLRAQQSRSIRRTAIFGNHC